MLCEESNLSGLTNSSWSSPIFIAGSRLFLRRIRRNEHGVFGAPTGQFIMAGSCGVNTSD